MFFCEVSKLVSSLLNSSRTQSRVGALEQVGFEFNPELISQLIVDNGDVPEESSMFVAQPLGNCACAYQAWSLWLARISCPVVLNETSAVN